MMSCEIMQDDMPERLHRGTPWSADESTHLSGCPECRKEVALVMSAMKMGQSHEFHPTLVEGRLLSVLKQESQPVDKPTNDSAWRWRLPVLVGLAATMALLIWSPQRPTDLGGEVEASTSSALFPELLHLSPEELQSVLGSWEEDDPSNLPSVVPTLENLDIAQLQRVLQQIEEGT